LLAADSRGEIKLGHFCAIGDPIRQFAQNFYCSSNNAKLSEADASGAPGAIKVLRKLPYWIANGAEMAKLYFTPAIRSEQFQPSVR